MNKAIILILMMVLFSSSAYAFGCAGASCLPYITNQEDVILHLPFNGSDNTKADNYGNTTFLASIGCSATPTVGQADPYGGTSAFRFTSANTESCDDTAFRHDMNVPDFTQLIWINPVINTGEQWLYKVEGDVTASMYAWSAQGSLVIAQYEGASGAGRLPDIVLGEWVLYVMIKDGATGNASVYYANDTSVTIKKTGLVGGEDLKLRVANGGVSNHPLDGYVSDYMFFKRVLTSDEIGCIIDGRVCLFPTYDLIYDSIVFEAQPMVHSVFFSKPNVTAATLYYNGTPYLPTGNTTTAINITFTIDNLTSPNVDSLNELKDLYWAYVFNGVNYNTTVEYQTVSQVALSECDGNITTETIILKLFDINDVKKNGSIESTWEISLEGSTNTLNYSFSKTDIFNQTICVTPNSAVLQTYALIEYTSPSYSPSFTYRISNLTLTNLTQSINLYLVNGTTQTVFTVQNQDTTPIADAYIHILLYDVGTNTYKTTEILKTDSQGQAIGNIILIDKYYNFLVYVDGILRYTEEGSKILTNSRTFTISTGQQEWIDDFDITLGVYTNLYFNNDTQNFVYTWSDPTSSMHFGCLRVDEINGSGKTTLSNTCLETTSGTILYNIPVLNNGTTYVGTGYLKYDFEQVTDVVHKIIAKITDLFTIEPDLTLFIAAIWNIGFFMLGLPNPTIAIAFLVIGAIVEFQLGLWSVSLLTLGSIVILALIQIYIMGRQRD